MATTTLTNPRHIQPWNDITDEDKYDTLVESMESNGWIGAPIVVIAGRDHGWGVGNPRAITGSHRIAAAIETGTGIPTVDLDELLAEHGLTLAALDDEYCTDPDDDRHEAAVVRLSDHLPADVVDHYGLDAH